MCRCLKRKPENQYPVEMLANSNNKNLFLQTSKIGQSAKSRKIKVPQKKSCCMVTIKMLHHIFESTLSFFIANPLLFDERLLDINKQQPPFGAKFSTEHLHADIICLEKRTVFRKLNFEEHIMQVIISYPTRARGMTVLNNYRELPIVESLIFRDIQASLNSESERYRAIAET